MTTTTITPADALAITIPGDLPGVLEGYVGPALVGGQEPAIAVKFDGWKPERFTLPLASWQVREHLIRRMLEGVRCEVCLGTGIAPPTAPLSCTLCKGTGYLRAPTDLRRFRDIDLPEIPGWPRAALSAALIGVSVLRVAAGMGPVTALFADWEPYYEGEHHYEHRVGIVGGTHAVRRAHSRDIANAYLLREERAALLDIDPDRGPVMRVEVP